METTFIAYYAVFVLSNFIGLRALKVCCPGLDCLTNDPPNDDLFLPQCPNDIGLNFKLFTIQNPSQGEEFTGNSIPPSFKADKMLMFIVHGHTLLGEKVQWPFDMKDKFLKQGDYNVVIVDWSGGSQLPNYLQAVPNTRTVGAAIASLAKNAIEKRGSSRDKLYCIGHCLGAQVCGHAGHGLKFGRITGLDAAPILFENRENGLNSSCADYVDAIHTGGELVAGLLRVGVMKTIGHVDFYPNRGLTQRGCEISVDALLSLVTSILKSLNPLNIFDLLQTVLTSTGPLCNHARAVDLFMESILTPCFVARQSCDDQFNLPWSCKSSANPQNMGFNSNLFSSRGIFFLETNEKFPFCKS